MQRISVIAEQQNQLEAQQAQLDTQKELLRKLQEQMQALIKSAEEVGVNFTMHLRLLTDQGLPVSDSFHFISHSYDREIYDNGTLVAPRYLGYLELPPGSYLFSVVLRDPQSFTFTELSRPIQVN